MLIPLQTAHVDEVFVHGILRDVSKKNPVVQQDFDARVHGQRSMLLWCGEVSIVQKAPLWLWTTCLCCTCTILAHKQYNIYAHNEKIEVVEHKTKANCQTVERHRHILLDLHRSSFPCFRACMYACGSHVFLHSHAQTKRIRYKKCCRSVQTACTCPSRGCEWDFPMHEFSDNIETESSQWRCYANLNLNFILILVELTYSPVTTNNSGRLDAKEMEIDAGFKLGRVHWNGLTISSVNSPPVCARNYSSDQCENFTSLSQNVWIVAKAGANPGARAPGTRGLLTLCMQKLIFIQAGPGPKEESESRQPPPPNPAALKPWIRVWRDCTYVTKQFQLRDNRKQWASSGCKSRRWLNVKRTVFVMLSFTSRSCKCTLSQAK